MADEAFAPKPQRLTRYRIIHTSSSKAYGAIAILAVCHEDINTPPEANGAGPYTGSKKFVHTVVRFLEHRGALYHFEWEVTPVPNEDHRAAFWIEVVIVMPMEEAALFQLFHPEWSQRLIST